MIQTLIHTSENNNSYIYDHQSRLSILIHPELIKAHQKLKDVDSYYLSKYEYLKKHNFFSTPKSSDFGTLNESMIKESINQTTQITFEVTDFCNLDCSYCCFGELYEGFDSRNKKNIDVNYAIKILNHFLSTRQKNKTRKLIIGFYGGEPLLNADFVKTIVNYINNLNSNKDINVEYYMTTNATLIHKHIDFLADNKFDLLISLDGNKNNHSYRIFKENQHNSFDKVIKNIDFIQDKHSEYFINHVSFNAVLHNRNSINEIYEFIYKRYNKIPRIAQLSSEDVKLTKKDIHNHIFHSYYKSEIEFQKNNPELETIMHSQSVGYRETMNFLKFNSINFYVSNILMLLHNIEIYLPTSSCLPGQKKILLTTNNKLLPCEKVNYKYSIGEVKQNVILDIAKITQNYNSYYNYIKDICKNCYANRFCNTCIFHLKNLKKNSSEKFICEYYCDSEEFKRKLYRIFSFIEKHPNDLHQIIENEIII